MASLQSEDSPVVRFPEVGSMYVVCTSDVTRDDMDRLMGLEPPGEPEASWLHFDGSGCVVHIDPQLVFDDDDLIWSPYYKELYGLCQRSGVHYLMFDRDAAAVRERSLWG